MHINLLFSMPSALTQEEWSKAAHALAGIDLDSGMRLLDAGDRVCLNHEVLTRIGSVEWLPATCLQVCHACVAGVCGVGKCH